MLSSGSGLCAHKVMVYLQYIYSMFIVYLQYIYSMFIVYLSYIVGKEKFGFFFNLKQFCFFVIVCPRWGRGEVICPQVSSFQSFFRHKAQDRWFEEIICHCCVGFYFLGGGLDYLGHSMIVGIRKRLYQTNFDTAFCYFVFIRFICCRGLQQKCEEH